MQIHEFRNALDSSSAPRLISAVDNLRYQLPKELREDLESSQLALWTVWHPDPPTDEPPTPPN